MKRSNTLWLLTLLFAWSTLKSMGTVLGAESVPDYVLLSSLGLDYWFYALCISLMLGEAGLTYLLFNKKKSAYSVGSIVLVAEVTVALVFIYIGIMHMDEMKKIYVASREARAMTANADMLGAPLLGAVALSYVVFYSMVYFFLRKIRPELADGAA
ncbi:MAG: hypothetical protein U1F34_01325 [Gammaproteobacteria bacterium]